MKNDERIKKLNEYRIKIVESNKPKIHIWRIWEKLHYEYKTLTDNIFQNELIGIDNFLEA